MPLSIGKKIFASFGSGEKGNLVTPEMQDKALCYVIVLGEALEISLSKPNAIFLNGCQLSCIRAVGE